MDRLVKLTSYVYEYDAQLLVLELQAAGIEAIVRKDDCGGMRPDMMKARGAEVLVDRGDLERATELFQAMEADRKASEQAGAVVTSKKSSKGFWVFLLGLALGVFVTLAYVGKEEATTVEDLSGVEAYDHNADGKIDAEYVYNSDGVMTECRFDANGDGAWDGWYFYKNGVAYRSKFDSDFNGIVDYRTTLEWNNPVMTVCKPNGNKAFGRTAYFEHGILTRETVDTVGDGVYDTEVRYDPFGAETSSQKL